MYDILTISVAFVLTVIVIAAFVMVRRRKKPTPKPEVPKTLSGPDIDAAKTAITDVTSKMESLLQSLIRQRDHVWNEGQREVDRLTEEINKTQIVIEAYRNTTSLLERPKPSDPLAVPAPIEYPNASVELETDEIEPL